MFLSTCTRCCFPVRSCSTWVRRQSRAAREATTHSIGLFQPHKNNPAVYIYSMLPVLLICPTVRDSCTKRRAELKVQSCLQMPSESLEARPHGNVSISNCISTPDVRAAHGMGTSEESYTDLSTAEAPSVDEQAAQPC